MIRVTVGKCLASSSYTSNPNPMNLAELKRAYKRSLIDNEASGSPNYGGRRFILAKEAGSRLGVSCQPWQGGWTIPSREIHPNSLSTQPQFAFPSAKQRLCSSVVIQQSHIRWLCSLTKADPMPRMPTDPVTLPLGLCESGISKLNVPALAWTRAREDCPRASKRRNMAVSTTWRCRQLKGHWKSGCLQRYKTQCRF